MQARSNRKILSVNISESRAEGRPAGAVMGPNATAARSKDRAAAGYCGALRGVRAGSARLAGRSVGSAVATVSAVSGRAAGGGVG